MDHEAALSQFVIPAKRERYVELFRTRKGRAKVLERLNHQNDFDARYRVRAPKEHDDEDGISRLLKAHGALTDLMAFIGHELQHAIEILSNPHVRNTEDLYLFYSRLGTRGKGPLDFETTAAIKAGEAIRAEIRAFRSRTTGVS